IAVIALLALVAVVPGRVGDRGAVVVAVVLALVVVALVVFTGRRRGALQLGLFGDLAADDRAVGQRDLQHAVFEREDFARGFARGSRRRGLSRGAGGRERQLAEGDVAHVAVALVSAGVARAVVALSMVRRGHARRGQRERRGHEGCEKHPFHVCNLLGRPWRG